MRKIVVILIALFLSTVVLGGCTEKNQEDVDGTDTDGSDDSSNGGTDGDDETPDDSSSNETQEGQTPPDEFLQQAEPYIQKVVFDSADLYAYAYSLLSDFDSTSRECRVNALYRDILTNYTCVAAPLGSSLLQTPQETIEKRQGTCEDLSILLCSLLFTIGIPSYLVFTDDHVYAMAYDVDVDALWTCAERSLIHHVEVLFEEPLYQHLVQPIALPAAGLLYIGGEDKTFDGLIDYMTIEYSFQSDQPLHLYVVPTQTEFFSLRDTGVANVIYEESNLTSKNGVIAQMLTFGGIALLNNNSQIADVRIDFTFTFQPSFYQTYNQNKLTVYSIHGKDSVILDPTVGDYGFPGYDAEVFGKKTGINPQTNQYVEFP